jgi:hypothetical protein
VAPAADYSTSAVINIANGGYAKTDTAFVVQSQNLSNHQCQLLTAGLASENRYTISWPEQLLSHRQSAVDKPTTSMPFTQLSAVANQVPNTKTQYQQSLQQLNSLSQLNALLWQGALSPGQLQQALMAAEDYFSTKACSSTPACVHATPTP